MNIDLAKALILDMLSLDDESLDILLEEVSEIPTREDLKPCLNPSYIDIILNSEDIKNAIRQLVEDKMVLVLDEKGKKLVYDSLDEILEIKTRYTFWFRMTKKGEEWYKSTEAKYWNPILHN